MVIVVSILFAIADATIQAATLQVRDEQSHKALAAELLYAAVVGPVPHEHAEIQAFRKGFQLPCNSGFSFLDVSASRLYVSITL